MGGGNYGWAFREGDQKYTHPPAGPVPTNLVEPVHAYKHGPTGASVTGGLVVGGQHYPGLGGAYLFGDFVLGAVFALVEDGAGYTSRRLTEQTCPIASFAARESGEVLIACFDGRIYALRGK